MLGIYIHIPFCVKKCPYCDFYSVAGDEELKEEYTKALILDMKKWQGQGLFADTLYFGGGTPLLLQPHRIARIINTASEVFKLSEASEITVEVNPSSVFDFSILADAGVNRISLGMQSSQDNELISLGRMHNSRDVLNAVEAVKKSGISNISLDWMLGIPNQTVESIKKTGEFIRTADVTHVSAYMLKIEENTPFYNIKNSLNIAHEDLLADFYLSACECLDNAGYRQYEISNFAKGEKISRHNLKYWILDEYLGFGASAHSFFGGERFFYPRDINNYIVESKAVSDGTGGSIEEYIMLRLRLNEGISFSDFEQRYSRNSSDLTKNASELLRRGLLISDDIGLRLSRDGFLISNSIISHILLNFENN